MDWSAAISLRTSTTKQYKANYGSYQTTTLVRSEAAAGTAAAGSRKIRTPCAIRIPESIPEHACVVQFTSPRAQALAEKVAELYYRQTAALSPSPAPPTNVDDRNLRTSKAVWQGRQHQQKGNQEREEDPADPSSNGEWTKKSQHMMTYNGDRFRSFVPRTTQEAWSSTEKTTSSAIYTAWPSTEKTTTSATYTAISLSTPAPVAVVDEGASNYWIQERAKQRDQQERRQRAMIGISRVREEHTPLKGTRNPQQYGACEEQQPMGSSDTASASSTSQAAWKTPLLFCSMPFALLIVFVVIILCQSPDRAA